MKKSISIALALIMALTLLSGCGKQLPLEIISDNELSDISAKEQTDMRVMQFNVKNCALGEEIDGIAEEIRQQKPHVVFLQELDWSAKRSNKKEILRLLAEELSMNYLYVPSMNYQGGQYGIGILSVFEIENGCRIELPVQDGEEPRVLAKAQINMNGKTVDIFNTHLSYESTETRSEQFAVLNEQLSASELFILCGDFNVESYTEFDALKNTVTVNNSSTNYNSYIPDSDETDLFLGIDNIIIPSNVKIRNSRMVNTSISDHNALVADIVFM